MHFLAQHAIALQRPIEVGEGQGVKATKLPLFEGEREKVVGFINFCHLYINMKIEERTEEQKVTWVLSYMQGEVAEVWKENILEEIAQGTSEVTTAEELFTKMRGEFGEFNEQSRKVNKLRILEQRSRTCNKYVQIFKKTVRESEYKRRPLIEEFKRGLNGAIRRRLAEVESLSSTIKE